MICRTAQNGKIYPAEHILFAHAIVIKFFQCPIEQIRNNPGIISKGSASERAKDQVLVSQISGDLQHTCDTIINHGFVLLLSHAFHTIAEHWRSARHDCNDDCFRQQIAVLILDDLHLRVDHQSM